MNNVMDNNFSNYNLPQSVDYQSRHNNFSTNIYPQSNSHLSRRGNGIMSAGPHNRSLNELSMNPMNFNQNMNELVRSNLKSRGINLVDHHQSMNYNQQYNPNYNQFQNEENYSFGYSGTTNNETNEKKKMLLNNIQQQMLLNRNTKMSELERKRKEDEKYLRDIESSYPFGKGGAGAPMRDKLGNIITNRRALISDPKYFHISTKIEDDFDEVKRNGGSMNNRRGNIISQGMQGNMGLQNFNPISNHQIRLQSGRNLNENINENLNANINEVHQFPGFNYNRNDFSHHIRNDQRINGMTNIPNTYRAENYVNNYPQNESQFQNYPNFNRYESNMNENSINNFEQNIPSNLNYMTNPIHYDNSDMTGKENSSSKNQLDINNLPNEEFNFTPNGATDENPKKKERQEYGNYLRSQMEISKKKKEMEKQEQKRKELEEEMRIKKELEMIKQQEEMQKEKKKLEVDKVFNENQALRDQYVVNKKKVNFSADHLPSNFSHTSQQHHSTQDNNYNNNNNNNLNENRHEEFAQSHQMNNIIEENLELKQTINNEILNLKNNFIDQQNILLKQLNDLKTETQNSNLQRYEVLKEFSTLKDEMSKQRVDEEMRRKYVYDVLVDNNTKATNIHANAKLPDLRQEDYKVELPRPKNHSKNIKEIYYDDTIKHPNRVQEIPNLEEFHEKKIKSDSKFIDLDTHNIYENLNIYEPEQHHSKKSTENSRGVKLDDDFGPLRSYYKEKEDLNDYYYHQNREYSKINLKEEKSNWNQNEEINSSATPNAQKNNLRSDFGEDLEYNKDILDKDTLSINQIYNKNLERLRYLNKLEENITYEARSINNYDDFLKKLDKMDTRSGNINL